MLTLWSYPDFHREMDDFRRRVHDLLRDYDGGPNEANSAKDGASGRLVDAGREYFVRVDVPGLTAEDIAIEATASALTISTERKVAAPEGYAVHRQERPAYRFSRSFTFAEQVDLERVQARVSAGVLEVSLPKAPEHQPRSISVRAG